MYLVDEKLEYFLKLPTFPKNIEELVIVRCWLEQLYNCAFESADFYQNVFNPELINILFDNDKTMPLQFNTRKASLWTNDETFENVFQLALNNLSVSEFLKINLCLTPFTSTSADIIEQRIDILFNILINESSRWPIICLEGFNLPRLYDLITEYITTSKDCSKMVAVIVFDSFIPNFKLNERAEKVWIRQLKKEKHVNYQIQNIFNPKVKFLFCNRERNDGRTVYVKMRKMKEQITGQ
uniref:Uncharacterized protein n=1 Tax=Meloidogyne enterolobii TaxID=390850 RepID=A0A6V7VXZ7_MELEN|nr:unnamed protein product [Meloidogyne enterolobii]